MRTRVAIVLVAPGDLIGWAIDRVTGRRGWSHVFVDPGWKCDGDPIVIDVSRTHGVQLSTFAAASEGRPTMRIELDDDAGRCVLDRLLPYLGKPYSYASMALQPLQTQRVGRGVYCSRVVAECLPDRLRGALPPCPAPADLAVLRRW